MQGRHVEAQQVLKDKLENSRTLEARRICKLCKSEALLWNFFRRISISFLHALKERCANEARPGRTFKQPRVVNCSLHCSPGHFGAIRLLTHMIQRHVQWQAERARLEQEMAMSFCCKITTVLLLSPRRTGPARLFQWKSCRQKLGPQRACALYSRFAATTLQVSREELWKKFVQPGWEDRECTANRIYTYTYIYIQLIYIYICIEI